jgi:hypothetical protein
MWFAVLIATWLTQSHDDVAMSDMLTCEVLFVVFVL